VIALARSARNEVEREFTEFASVMAPRLLRSAVLLCGDRQLAEDLVQTTLAKLFVSWGRVCRADSREAYAHGTLTKTFLSHQRLRRSGERPARVDEGPETPAVPDETAGVETRVDLLAGLSRLDASDRAVLVLRYWEDRSVAETAQALGLTDANVRTRAARAAGRLRAVLSETKKATS
jgi:RNA polymerase sigma-70 factor (sigma-E family)